MVEFSKLWDSYPDKETVKKTCTNKQQTGDKPFENYCAILLSDCFNRSGVSIAGYGGKTCWSHSGAKHALLAEELADWLAKRTPTGFGKREKIPPGSFQDELKDRTGVIYFKDYWQRGKESFNNRSGDHVDLWNKSAITSGPMWFRTITEFLGFVSDLNKCKEIWFWEVK